MRSFAYHRATNTADAARMAALHGDNPSNQANARFLAGGTTLVDLMKLDVLTPGTVIDINGLRDQFGRIEAGPAGLKLGSLVTMADARRTSRDPAGLSCHRPVAAPSRQPAVAQHGEPWRQRPATHPLFLFSATRAGPNATSATPAPAAPRCTASRATMPCWAAAITASPAIRAISPPRSSRWARRSTLQGPDGNRVIAFEDLHRLPGDTPQVETNLKPGRYHHRLRRAGRAMDAPVALPENTRSRIL